MQKEIIQAIHHLKITLHESPAVLIGAGSGLSTAAGYTYDGQRFAENFQDFMQAYGVQDMYSAGFYPFPNERVRWAYWSRTVMLNRYQAPPFPVYEKLLHLVQDKDYFVLTTNVDHMFQRAGFDKLRLFYTQGDYGLFQCSVPCHAKTYDNETTIRAMVAEQKDMQVPSHLVPHCPRCGESMTMNLRIDDTFVENEGWQAANQRYLEFLQAHEGKPLLLLEIGVGMNTPGIIKYPFWHMAKEEPRWQFASLNQEVYVPEDLRKKSILIRGDLRAVIDALS